MNDETFFQKQAQKTQKWFKGINLNPETIAEEVEPLFYNLLESFRQDYQELLQTYKNQMASFDEAPSSFEKQITHLHVLVDALLNDILELNQALAFYMALAHALNKALGDSKDAKAH